MDYKYYLFSCRILTWIASITHVAPYRLQLSKLSMIDGRLKVLKAKGNKPFRQLAPTILCLQLAIRLLGFLLLGYFGYLVCFVGAGMDVKRWLHPRKGHALDIFHIINQCEGAIPVKESCHMLFSRSTYLVSVGLYSGSLRFQRLLGGGPQ